MLRKRQPVCFRETSDLIGQASIARDQPVILVALRNRLSGSGGVLWIQSWVSAEEVHVLTNVARAGRLSYGCAYVGTRLSFTRQVMETGRDFYRGFWGRDR